MSVDAPDALEKMGAVVGTLDEVFGSGGPWGFIYTATSTGTVYEVTWARQERYGTTVEVVWKSAQPMSIPGFHEPFWQGRISSEFLDIKTPKERTLLSALWMLVRGAKDVRHDLDQIIPKETP